ncbi:hypothetical protein [Flavobacterium psychrophilum]|uniref:hypothetical protein n=1 Tax=Flavobacterium psychrophilum TaxID=96345 RepID=UPI001D0754B3|nr:hypothetical protein [Flavobacterium psychrophilum]MCB6062526.1 hypothetical protein [Flavobacterium psychrophilum]MEB3378386.1 hypothetical protein [Flavobacterium psychrophilum]
MKAIYEAIYDNEVIELREQVCNYLEITNDEYFELVFECGIDLCQTIEGLNPEVIKLKSYWDFMDFFFSRHNYYYFNFLETLKKPYKKEVRREYYIKSMFDNYSISILIANRLNDEIDKAKKPPCKPQTPKAKNNQLETNLNTI